MNMVLPLVMMTHCSDMLWLPMRTLTDGDIKCRTSEEQVINFHNTLAAIAAIAYFNFVGFFYFAATNKCKSCSWDDPSLVANIILLSTSTFIKYYSWFSSKINCPSQIENEEDFHKMQ